MKNSACSGVSDDVSTAAGVGLMGNDDSSEDVEGSPPAASLLLFLGAPRLEVCLGLGVGYLKLTILWYCRIAVYVPHGQRNSEPKSSVRRANALKLST